MNWADIAATTSSSQLPYYEMPSRHRLEVLRSEGLDDGDDSDEMDEKHEYCGSGSTAMRFPDTHLGRLASIFSERMPCTGMYGPAPSMAQDSAFSMHGIDPCGGSDEPDDVAMRTLEDGASTGGGSSISSYMLQPSMDMPSLDEQTSVDLQQLFPTGGSSEDTEEHTMSHSESASGRSCYPSYPSHHASPSLPSDHDLGSSIDQFSEPYQSLPSHADHASAAATAHMMVPFPFGTGALHPHSAFDDDHDELAMQDASASAPSPNAMEMQEVSNLFNNASLMTPPTAITMPRTTIVSPLNGFGPPRMMLPPSLRDLAKTESLASAFDDDDSNAKFSPDRRKLCCVDDCKSQARAFNRCKRHGGSKRCSYANCTKSVQSRGLCIRHGGGSRCQEQGCTRAAQSHGKCKMHGGGRPCVVPGCEKKAHLKRLCRKHGGGAKCSLPDCDKWAQRQGMCMTHSKHQHALLASPPPSPASSSAESPSEAQAATSTKRPAPVRTFLDRHDAAI